MKNIPYSRQYIDTKDLKYVNQVLKSDFLTKGKQTLIFEKSIQNKLKCKYAVSTINASSALILACKVLNLQKNDYVWTASITYIASINCALHCGAKIGLVDIDQDTNNISIEDLEKRLILAKKKKKLPKIVIVVHLGGVPCDLLSIHKLSKKYNFKIIEDASHAIGSKYKELPIGNCKYSAMTVFSFHPVKTITSAEGGVITTNNKNIYNKLVLLRENGHKKIDNFNDPNFYDVTELGFNFRINEINACLGISQLKNLTKFIKKKNLIALKYIKLLDKRNLEVPKYNKNLVNSWHLFIIKVNFNNLKISKSQFITRLRKKKIFLNTHYIPLYKFSLIKKFIKRENFKNSENYYKNAISIPIYPQMASKEQAYVISNLNKELSNTR